MRFTPTLLACLVAGSTFSLTACHDSNNSGGSTTSQPTTREVTVTPSLGKILKGRVVLKNALTRKPIVDIKSIGSNGTVTFSVDINQLKQPIIAEVLPTADGKFEYADEAISSQAVSMDIAAADINKAILRAAASVSSTANSNIGVTALTEAALQQAEKAEGGLTAASIDLANSAVKSQLKLNFDITQPPVVLGLNDFGKLLDQNSNAAQRAYATYLATLAKEAKRLNSSSTQPAYDILKAFAADFSDGTFDAKQGSTALSFYSSNFIKIWANWVSSYYNQLLNFKTLNDFNGWFSSFNAENTNPTIPATPIRTVDGIAEYACSDESKLKSLTSAAGALNLSFINKGGQSLNIDWLNYAGTPSRYSTGLASTQTYMVPTYVTHPWKIATTTGTCRGIFVATKPQAATLTIKDDQIIINEQTTTPTDTCASKNLPVTTLSSISAYAGDYKDQGVVVFNLNTSTATATVKGVQIANIKEVCGPTNLSNGTNHVLITDKGNVTLFKTTAGVYSAEGFEFVDKTKVFYGEKAATTPTLCESAGADDKLGFKNAPSDFCSFSKATSVAITSPDAFTFFNSDKKQNVKIILNNGKLVSVALENNQYAWACGVGALPACTGITFKTTNNNTEFTFNNAVLSVVNGTTQPLTIKNGSLIHLGSTTPPPAGSCNGNTNPYGCLTITGVGAPVSYYEHIGNPMLDNGKPFVQFNPLVPNSGAVTYFGGTATANSTISGVSVGFQKVVGATQNASFTFIQYDSALNPVKNWSFLCKNSESTCPGLSVNTDTRTITFNNVVMNQIQPADGTIKLTFNGTMKF